MYYVRKSYGFETKFSLKFMAHYVDKLNPKSHTYDYHLNFQSITYQFDH